jgi:hypothetical protein
VSAIIIEVMRMFCYFIGFSDYVGFAGLHVGCDLCSFEVGAVV